MKDFELAVAQQIARVHALEKALHDEGPWAFRLGDTAPDGSRVYVHGIPATRRIEPETQKVVFTGELFSNYDQEVLVDLMTVRDREPVSTRAVRLPLGASVIEWELSLPSAVAA
jgi:hypothetical protein